MQKTVIILVSIIGVIALGWFVFNPGKEAPSVARLSEPWIEVMSDTITARTGEGINKDLKTGDRISSGTIISSSKTGKGIIHFGDGSVLRVDNGTTLTLDEGVYLEDEETLVVRITLTAGQVWSKIIALASPASSWEVKTSNAVATVRGTAFGTKYQNGKTKFMGSEHTVKIALIDPKTKEKKDITTELKEKTIIEIGDTDVERFKAKPELFASSVKEASKEISADTWALENEVKDKEIEGRLEEKRKETDSEKEVRKKFREEVYEEFKKAIEEREEVVKEEGEGLKAIEEKTGDTGTENKTEETTTRIQTGITVTETQIKPVSLILVSKSNLLASVEGSRVSIQAMLVFSDGTRKDVTLKVKWNVSPKIGAMPEPGVFMPAFPPEESESPEVIGTIGASYSEGGVSFTAKPIEIKVFHTIEETLEIG